MSRNKEEWRDIPGYDGWYQISDWGRVRSYRALTGKALLPGESPARAKDPRLLKIFKKQNRGSTAVVNLQTTDRRCRQTPTVARLMAITWLGGIPPGMEACHADGNPDNNCLWNIVLRDAATQNRAIGRTGGNRRPVVKIDETLTVVAAYGSAAEAARENGFSARAMRDYCDRKIRFSIFAPDGFIYAWDDARRIWATLQRAMRELDAIGRRYNDPFTGKYFDLPLDDDLEVDIETLWWNQASDLVGATSERVMWG